MPSQERCLHPFPVERWRGRPTLRRPLLPLPWLMRDDYWISPKGPSSLGKLRVLNAWMPASWSPSNAVTVSEQPASLASSGSPNHNPRWKVCTGSKAGFFSASWSSTCGALTLPGANTNNSSLKMPLARTSPLPWLLVVKSAWYQEMPKGLLGCWVTNSSNSVFLGAWLRVTSMTCWSVGVVRTSTWALAPSRQSLSTAVCERTILKEVVLSTSKAAAAARAAITSAAPNMSSTRLIVRFIVVPFFALLHAWYVPWFATPASDGIAARIPNNHCPPSPSLVGSTVKENYGAPL